MVTSAPTRPRPVREGWIDLLRGGATAITVCVHAIALAESYGDDGAALGVIGVVVRSLRAFAVPMTIVLAGMFLGPALAKGLRRYAWVRFATVLWPFVVWTLVEIAPSAPAASDVVRALVLSDLDSPMWFLWYLCLFAVVAVPLRRLPVLATAPVLIVSSLVLEIVLGSGADDDGLVPRATRFLFFLGLYLVGDAWGRNRVVVERWMRERWTIVVAAALTLATALLAALGVPLHYRPESAPGVLAAIVVGAALARLVQHRRGVAPLIALGRNSIVLYVTHLTVLKIADVVLTRLGVTDTAALWGLSVTTALLVAYTWARAVERWQIAELPFALPAGRAGRLRRG